MNTRRIAVSTIVLTLFVCTGISPVSAQESRFRPYNPSAQQATDKPAADKTTPLPPASVPSAADKSATDKTTPPQPVMTTTPLQPVEPSVEQPTAALAQKWLEEGNARFRAQQRQSPNSGLSRAKETAQNGQHPFVTILSCSDSRAPLEIIFDRGIGDMFVIRVAGNVAGESETGSIEYGVEHVGTPLLVVLGHTKCGAVTAAATHAHTEGCITKLVERIQPAVDNAKKGTPDIKDEELIEKAVVENVWVSVKTLVQSSEIIRHLVKEEKLRVVGAVYDIETGAVKWLGEHAEMKTLLGEVSAPASTPAPVPAWTSTPPSVLTQASTPPPMLTQATVLTPLAPAPPIPASTLTMELRGPDEVQGGDNVTVTYTLVVRNVGTENAVNLNLKLVQDNNSSGEVAGIDAPLLPGESKEIPVYIRPSKGQGHIDIAVSATDSQGLKSEVNRRIQVVSP